MVSKYPSSHSNNAAVPPPSEYRLLLVDDDEDEFVLLQDIVAHTRRLSSVDWVNNFDAALKVIQQEAHDVYLVDYYLGAQTGVELLRMLRERDCFVPIIILTGRDGEDIDMEALEAGATDYLEKGSLTPTLLERAVRYAHHIQHNQNHLEMLVKQVTRLEQLKSDLIRIAAHDLRGPLTVMHGYIAMISEEPTASDPNVQSHLERMRSSVTHMQKMIADLLSLEHIEEMTGGHTNPVDFIATVQNVYQHYQQQSRHTFSLRLPQDPVIAYGVELLLRQAVENLIGNAVKYTPDTGSIIVEISVDADTILFTVTDTGFGVPQNLQADLFKPFFRARSREVRHIEGTGLGLSLVKNIVERHNGHVFFESEHGKGSTFGFMLPQVQQEGV